MKPKLVVLISLLLSILSLQHLKAQQSAQKQKLFFEKVYLHIDREYYFAGDDIWYKAYLLNAQVNQLLNTSNNLYVELIAPNASIIDRKVIRLEEGIGNGDFKLSDSIPAGTYRIRAYTNWMKNFGDNFIFEKQIQISNDLQASKPNNKSATTSNVSGNVAASSSKNIVRFFPEGGSLIDGVASIVAFKVENALGKGVKAKGAVLSSKGDTITKFESKESGVGAFLLQSSASEKYLVKGIIEDKTPFSATLPEVLSKGFSMRAVTLDSVVKVILSTNEATLGEFKGKQLEIKARHSGVPYFAAKFEMTQPQVIIQIAKADFPTGIAALTLTDDQAKAHCERLVYMESKQPAKISILTNKPVYKSKERVVVSIKAFDSQNKPAKANLSIAAIDASILPETKANILSYYFLESEVRGKIDNPKQYFDQSNPDRAKQLDLLLMTQGWRDFLWKRLKDTALVIKNLNETGFTISGTVTEKNSTKPLSGLNVTLFANGAKGGKLFSAVTNAEGKYYFDNINLEGSQKIKLMSVDNKAKKTGKINLDSLTTTPLSIVPISSATEGTLIATFNTEASKRKELIKKYSLSDTISLKEVSVKSSKTVRLFGETVTSFGYPDQNFVISPKDYDYNSLSHYLMTNVNGAMPSDSAGSNGVEFLSNGKKVRPIFIVDRREDLFDRMDYYDLRMDQVEKITVRHMLGMRGQDSLGNREYNGGINDVYLIYLTLKPTAFQRQELSLINTTVTGYYNQRIFYSPVYYSAGSTKTDLRNTLYWNPAVKTDETGSATIYFYNADPKSKINISVEGTLETGVPVAGEGSYLIK